MCAYVLLGEEGVCWGARMNLCSVSLWLTTSCLAPQWCSLVSMSAHLRMCGLSVTQHVKMGASICGPRSALVPVDRALRGNSPGTRRQPSTVVPQCAQKRADQTGDARAGTGEPWENCHD